MAKIPRSVQVVKAIRALRRELKATVRATNKLAAKRLTRGDYAGAQAMIESAQGVSAFDREVASLQSRWKGLRSATEPTSKNDLTPLWEYYQPILHALVALGGTATRQEIEKQLEATVEGWLKEGDLVANTRGIPRWKQLVGRARKHMTAEGFLENGPGREWRITKKGEQAAKPSRKE